MIAKDHSYSRVETILTTPLSSIIVLQYDVREDEEQNVKLTECIDLLLAAGYFRARIKGLTPFDKVCKYTSDWPGGTRDK